MRLADPDPTNTVSNITVGNNIRKLYEIIYFVKYNSWWK